MLGCCLIYFHFLWAILSTSTVGSGQMCIKFQPNRSTDVQDDATFEGKNTNLNLKAGLWSCLRTSHHSVSCHHHLAASASLLSVLTSPKYIHAVWDCLWYSVVYVSLFTSIQLSGLELISDHLLRVFHTGQSCLCFYFQPIIETERWAFSCSPPVPTSLSHEWKGVTDPPTSCLWELRIPSPLPSSNSVCPLSVDICLSDTGGVCPYNFAPTSCLSVGSVS